MVNGAVTTPTSRSLQCGWSFNGRSWHPRIDRFSAEGEDRRGTLLSGSPSSNGSPGRHDLFQGFLVLGGMHVHGLNLFRARTAREARKGPTQLAVLKPTCRLSHHLGEPLYLVGLVWSRPGRSGGQPAASGDPWTTLQSPRCLSSDLQTTRDQRQLPHLPYSLARFFWDSGQVDVHDPLGNTVQGNRPLHSFRPQPPTCLATVSCFKVVAATMGLCCAPRDPEATASSEHCSKRPSMH